MILIIDIHYIVLVEKKRNGKIEIDRNTVEEEEKNMRQGKNSTMITITEYRIINRGKKLVRVKEEIIYGVKNKKIVQYYFDDQLVKGKSHWNNSKELSRCINYLYLFIESIDGISRLGENLYIGRSCMDCIGFAADSKFSNEHCSFCRPSEKIHTYRKGETIILRGVLNKTVTEIKNINGVSTITKTVQINNEPG